MNGAAGRRDRRWENHRSNAWEHMSQSGSRASFNRLRRSRNGWEGRFNHEWTRINTNVVGRLCQTPTNAPTAELARPAAAGERVSSFNGTPAGVTIFAMTKAVRLFAKPYSK